MKGGSQDGKRQQRGAAPAAAGKPAEIPGRRGVLPRGGGPAFGRQRPTYTYYETGHTTPGIADLYLLSQLYGRAMEDFLQ